MKKNHIGIIITALLSLVMTKNTLAQSSNEKKLFTDNELRKLFIISGDSGVAPGVSYGGMVLFKNSFTHKTGCDIKKANPQTTLFVDQEGGEVIRLEQYPLVSAKAATKQSLDQYYKNVKEVAKGLSNSCIDANLAPVVELNRESRSYGENKKKVYDYASTFVSAMKSQGVTTVLKHFPGEADNCKTLKNLDHLGLKLKHNTEAYECNIVNMSSFRKNTELFKEVNADAVMMGQGIYTNFSQYPALLEPKMRQWLVEDLQYKKVIISDALWEIEATPKTILMALKTVDWVMVGMPSNVENVLPLLHKAIETGLFTTQEIQKKLDLIEEFKNKSKTKN